MYSQQHKPVLQKKTSSPDRANHPRAPVAQPERTPAWASALPLQTKLTMNEPGDGYEQEADRTAELVMRMPEPRVQRKCACGGTAGEDDECEVCKAKRLALQRKAGARTTGTGEAPASVHDTLRRAGQPLDADTRAFFEPRFGHDFSGVRVHTDAPAAKSASQVKANAYTVGQHVVFGAGQYAPGTAKGDKLLAHELTHVTQQDGASLRLQREGDAVEVEVVGCFLTEYRPARSLAGGPQLHRLGEAAMSSILVRICSEAGGRTTFHWFNFATGHVQSGTAMDWEYRQFAGGLDPNTASFARLGSQLSPAQWQALPENPTARLLQMHEEGRITIDDPAIVSTYRGMVNAEAENMLNENEAAIDEVLNAPNRVQRIREYSTGLKEASQIRDALETRRDELRRSLVQAQGFSFGYAGRFPSEGLNPYRRFQIQRELGSIVDQALPVWYGAFPLLTRLRTSEIHPERVEAVLREIKANIISTRAELARAQVGRGSFDLFDLQPVRQQVDTRLGPRATQVIAGQDRSRAIWGTIGAVGLLAGSIALLFLPGGIFIDAAVGIAIAASAVHDAFVIGRAANTGLDIDQGLMSQQQALGAQFSAVLAVIFAVVGAAAAGYRVLRIGLALRGLGHSMPGLTLAERGAVARAIADDPALLSTFTRLAPGDAAVSARVATAVRQAAGDVRALRTVLQDVARIAAIPRRIPAGPDLYEPLRQIVDGSDIERIAQQTGLPRVQVEAAKQNLMLDEHILVDNSGALYRARFEPFEDIARIWGRAARGEALSQADRRFLSRLVRHEQAEGAILSASGRTLEQAFLRGELEGRLRTFLQSLGWNQAKINAMLEAESRPITPYRYAHLVAALRGAPNP